MPCPNPWRAISAAPLAVLVIAAASTGCDPATMPAADAGADARADAEPCSRNACPTGCCDSDGVCRRDDAVTACGTDGRSCRACVDDEVCRAGLCTRFFVDAAGCTPETCRGCCSGRQCIASPSDTYCGAGGGACALCPFYDECVDGACTPDPTRCGPHNCDGCCEDGYTCVTEPTTELCGSGGFVCENCPEGGYRACVDGLCVP